MPPGENERADASAVQTETTIRIYSTHEAADIAVANLRAHGISCTIDADDAGGMMPNLTRPGGVRLSVRAADASAAAALLDQPVKSRGLAVKHIIDVGPDSPPAQPLPPYLPEPGSRLRVASGWMFLGLFAGVLVCVCYQWCSQLGTRTRYVYNTDGVKYQAMVYYDGRLIQTMTDRNHDGSWDYWAYYDHGHLVRAEYDNNFDGKPDEFYTYKDEVLQQVENPPRRRPISHPTPAI